MRLHVHNWVGAAILASASLGAALTQARQAPPSGAADQPLAQTPEMVTTPRDPLSAVPRPAWQQGDPADSLYRAARAALNRNDYRQAAELFRRIPRTFPRSVYAGDALYWEAFALYREGGSNNLERAEAALDDQADDFPRAATRGDANALRQRIRGARARAGDSNSAENVTRAADSAAQGCAVEDDDDDVRVTALNALLQMDADRAVPILKQLLTRRDACSQPLRKKAVFLVSQQRTPETEDILLNVARSDPSTEVRADAVFWLSQVPGEKSITLLEQILKTASMEEEVLEKAVFAISQHRSSRAGQILRDYAENAAAPTELREKAIFWLGQQNNAENAAYLRTLFTRLTDEELKEKVLFSISQRNDTDSDRWLVDVAMNEKEPIEVRKKALFWAGQGRASIALLSELYSRITNEELKEQLIFVYSQRNETVAVDKLLDIAKNETNRELRKKAIFWLSQSKDERVAKFLLDIINQ
jgi:HEAT repeat protein